MLKKVAAVVSMPRREFKLQGAEGGNSTFTNTHVIYVDVVVPKGPLERASRSICKQTDRNETAVVCLETSKHLFMSKRSPSDSKLNLS